MEVSMLGRILAVMLTVGGTMSRIIRVDD